MVYPERKVLAICGDGGFMMNAQELETAVRLKLDLVILLLRDDAYGMIRWKQADMGYADYGMQFGNPDFVRFAEAHGAHGHRPQSADEFLPTLQRAFDQGGVHLIDLAIDYSDNHRVLGEEIQSLSAAVKE
jgi:acetolactate synthase-1/2/3 large subunit